MAKYLVNDTSLAAVADAIRAKGGTTEALTFPDGFVSAVEGIQAGGGGSAIDDVLSDNATEIYSEAESLAPYALYERKKLEKIDMPKVVSSSVSVFQGSSALKEVNMPVLKTMGRHMFRACTSLEYIVFPAVTNLINSAMYGCTSLKVIDLPVCTKFEWQSLYNASALKVLILRASSCPVIDSSVIDNTPFDEGGSGGYVLVPSALVVQYPNATNWAALYAYGNMQFLAIEDYTIDGTIMGELDWDKVNALIEGGTA